MGLSIATPNVPNIAHNVAHNSSLTYQPNCGDKIPPKKIMVPDGQPYSDAIGPTSFREVDNPAYTKYLFDKEDGDYSPGNSIVNRSWPSSCDS